MKTYQEDLDLFESNHIGTIELQDEGGLSRLLLVPSYQGRVMTSTANGLTGHSYGWVNHRYITAGKINHKFNPFGGEERFWLGPEGGTDSWYFRKGEEQNFSNWKVPAAFDTDVFDIMEVSRRKAVFQKKIHLKNASDVQFDILMHRSVALLDRNQMELMLGCRIDDSLDAVAYCSDNAITNESLFKWDKTTSMPSIWMLGMFSPSERATVILPYNKDCIGKILNDDYFGKTPADRLKVEDGVIYFKVDGRHRSKIGLPQGSATDLVCSYDAAHGILTLIQYTIPEGEVEYVNSRWGIQDERYYGDVINSYNDGPTEDGTVMGPFFEIETSSPAAKLDRGETLHHLQTTFHLEGKEEILRGIINGLFGDIRLDF